ncbi:MAG TPA: hypothetical protein VNE39_05545 [Planctomycetota bacterium]|nr:hypothetical protein [Planctomycetota bacterium]
MSKSHRAGRVACLASLLLPCWAAIGAEPGQGTVKVSGRVAVSRDQARGVRGATLTTPKGEVYRLVMDERGRSLGGVMHGESAEVFAIPSDKDGAKWLQVLAYADDRLAAGHEYWRRMRCLACVVLPATRNAAVPANLRGATPVAGRFFPLKRQFTAWTRDATCLWVAGDTELLQVDLAACKVLRSFGREEGLPDRLVYQLLSDGKTLWIVHRGGVAALDIGKGRIVDLPRLKAAFAQVFADAGGVWVVADTGTFRLKAPGGEPAVFPALPTAEQIRRVVETGIWTAHWRRRTGHLITAPASIGERLYAGSYGDLYELADGKWQRIAEGGWQQAVHDGKLWFLNAQGLAEYDPQTGKTSVAAPPESVRGRYTRLLVTDTAAWLVAEPEGTGKEGPPAGGGLARFDLAKRNWQAWPKINDLSANAVACIAAQDGAVWAATMEGRYRSRSAHPGMTTTSRLDFDATGFALHRRDEKAGKWDSYPLAMPELEKRLICGQDGKRSMDVVTPQSIEELSVGGTRIFALARLMPKQFFGGYWPCIEQVASRPGPGDAWAAAFGHHPEQTCLEGEQPLVLNISSGELTRIGSSLKEQRWEAVGHDLVLGLFALGRRHWAVTEGCIAVHDEAVGQWRRLVEPDFRWYWRATAALDDGRSLTVGSDRGLVCRLDLASGRFEFLGALKDRTISRLAKDKNGALMAAGSQAPLGRLPVQLADTLKPLDSDAARFDGKAWTAAKPEDLPPAGSAPPWSLKQFERKDHLDKSQGNYLCGPPNGQPRYYVKEVFFPQFLCASADGRRMWLSTYTGIVRLDLDAK